MDEYDNGPRARKLRWRRWRQDESPKGGVVTWRARFLVLPLRVRLLLLVLLTCAAAPAAGGVYATFGRTPFATALQAHPAALGFGALLVAGAVIVVCERPRSASLGAYARQLGDRILEVQSTFDGALRRRAREGTERNHVAQHSWDSNR